ncbi:MAG TPA: hypothetical protein VH084_29930 [Mycobacterium sp.]|jgi:hypothetical protein|nr:hypothetical protein [Mycobacterium sp.]
MALRVCDETFYWFLTVKVPNKIETDEEREIREALGLAILEQELNLWPCRLCGAMVLGSLRPVHREFHARDHD